MHLKVCNVYNLYMYVCVCLYIIFYSSASELLVADLNRIICVLCKSA